MNSLHRKKIIKGTTRKSVCGHLREGDYGTLGLAPETQYYLWQSSPGNSYPYPFIPLLRDNSPERKAEFLADVGQDYDGYALFLNEVDTENRAYMTPLEAAGFFVEMVELYPRIRWVGPNCSAKDLFLPHEDENQVNNLWLFEFLIWLRRFRVLKNLHAIGIHVYDKYAVGRDVNWCVDSIRGSRPSAGAVIPGSRKPIWVTEIGDKSSPENDRMWLEQCRDHRFVERFFVFVSRGQGQEQNPLMLLNHDGTLTQRGEQFIGV